MQALLATTIFELQIAFKKAKGHIDHIVWLNKFQSQKICCFWNQNVLYLKVWVLSNFSEFIIVYFKIPLAKSLFSYSNQSSDVQSKSVEGLLYGMRFYWNVFSNNISIHAEFFW